MVWGGVDKCRLFQIGGSRYISNYQTFGSPVYDDMPINQLKEISYKDWVRYEKGISTFTDRVIWG